MYYNECMLVNAIVYLYPMNEGVSRALEVVKYYY